MSEQRRLAQLANFDEEEAHLKEKLAATKQKKLELKRAADEADDDATGCNQHLTRKFMKIRDRVCVRASL